MVNVRSPSSLSMVGCGGGNPMVSSSPRSPGEHAVRLLHSLSFPSMANVNYFNGSGDSHSPAEMNVKLKNLPDQYEGVSTHTERGIHFLDKLGSFLRDRAVVEQEYAGKLKHLIRKYLPRKKEEEDSQYTTSVAFRAVLDEVVNLSNQHEVIAENLSEQVSKEITILVKDLKEQRKKCLLRGTQLQQQLSSQMAALDRAKKAYDRAFRESERAAENFYKADRDLNLSRAEVEKHRMTSIAKSQACTDAKSEYALQLNKTNELQRDHYYTKMPDVFRDLQGLDEKRINAIRTFLHRSVSIERERQPIKESCLDGILKAADSINQIADSAAVIERFKSGFSPPTDIPFEDLSVPPPSPEAGPNGSAVLSPSNGAHTNGKIGGLSLKGTISGKGFKKTRAGLKGLFGGNANNKLFSSTSALESTNGMCSFLKDDVTDLPPNQRKRHLQQRLDTITTNIQQKQSLRDGLIKMRTVYIENPHYGDAASTEDQLKEIEAALSALDQERVRISRELEMLLNGASDRTSLSDQESLSRSASDSSVSNPSSGHPAPHPAPSGGRGSRINSMGLRAHAANATNPPSSHTFRNYQQYWSQLHLNVDLENARRGWLNTSDGDSSNVVRVETSREYSTRDVHVPHHHHMLPIQMHSPDADGEGSSNSPESGLGTSHISLHDSDPEDEFQPLPVIGRCRALYPFEAQSDGAIPMCEGEELFVLETDQGDGWTRVRRIEDSEEGFVPTSYIESTLHTSVA